MKRVFSFVAVVFMLASCDNPKTFTNRYYTGDALLYGDTVHVDYYSKTFTRNMGTWLIIDLDTNTQVTYGGLLLDSRSIISGDSEGYINKRTFMFNYNASLDSLKHITRRFRTMVKLYPSEGDSVVLRLLP